MGNAMEILQKRRDFYIWRRDNRDAHEHDTLNEWEKYDFAAEVIEFAAMELGLKLPERAGRHRPHGPTLPPTVPIVKPE